MTAKTSPNYGTGVDVMGVEVESADGAIGIKNGTAIITKSTAAALTLALPTAGADDGLVLRILSTTAAAHTITTPASGLNGASHIATFAGNIGSSVELVAYNGSWYMQNDIGCTLS